MKNKNIDKLKIKQLINDLNFNYDNILWNLNFNERVNELTKDLNQTIEFLNNCNENEFYWLSETFEDLIIHFNSKKLIDCIEFNAKKFPNIKKDLDQEISYAKLQLK